MRFRRALLVAAFIVCVLAINGEISAQQPDAGAPPSATAAPPAVPAAPAVTVTPEMREHQRWVDTLYFVGTAYGFLVLLVVLGLGISRRLRDLATRVTQRTYLKAMIFFALFTLVTTVLSFPMDYFSEFVIPHRYSLTDQSLGGWLLDQGKGMLVGILLGAPIMALALLGIAKIKRWWLALWIGSIPIVLLLLLIAPVVLEPVFNDFKPLQDQKLKTELLDLASQAGITGGRVFQVDKSKQTKTLNAYVNGLGPTKRIVLWDTIIAAMDHDELKFVMAHEMGHYVLHHVWKEVVFLLALLLVVFWVGQKAVEWATRRWGGKWGFATPADPAALPLLLLVVSVVFFLLSPVINGMSRYFEHEADTFSLELTHLNDAGVRAFVKFAENSKVLPDPSPFIRFWRYSHPTLAERIVYCNTYKPWEKGEPNRAWKAR